MIISYPDDPSVQIPRRALAKRTAGFIGVATTAGATGAQRFIPIRLQFNEFDLGCRADSILLNQYNLQPPISPGNGEFPPESSVPTLPLSSPETCPFAAGGSCPPANYLDVTLGNQDLGYFAFYPTGFNSLHALALKRRAIQIISGKRLVCHQMELRLRGKPTLQHVGRPILYVDITIRSGTTLEKTLANARGTANRWFRVDRFTD